MSEPRPRLLVLQGKFVAEGDLGADMSERYEIERVADVDKAIVRLRESDFHAVFADVGDFLPLERNLVGQQSSLVLDTIGEGVCIVGDSGDYTWCNKRMRTFEPEVLTRVSTICRQAMSLFGQQSGPMSDPTQSRSKKFSFQLGDERYFEMVVSPVQDDAHKVAQVVAVVWDETSGRRLQQKIDAIDSAGRELARLESEMIAKLSPKERLDLLRDKIIRYSKDLMHFDHFAIRVLDSTNNKLELVIAEGLPTEATEVELHANPEGNGISGYVASAGRSYICHDTSKDPLYVFGLEGSRSSLTVPLLLHDKVIGVYNIESERIHAFSEDDRQFAEIFGRNIAMALNLLDLLVRERCTTNLQMADSVVQEVAEPLNDIRTEAQTLLDDYIKDPALRERLSRIVNHVDSIKSAVHDVAAGPKAILHVAEAVESSSTTDPVLGGKRVLVADDERNIRETIAQILRKHGSQVRVCCDGLEACNALAEQTFDMVISDIRMPHRNGYEVFSSARKHDDDLPVILMTGFGYDPNHSIVRASEEGLAAVLFKPFKAEQLLEQVRNALTENSSEANPQT